MNWIPTPFGKRPGISPARVGALLLLGLAPGCAARHPIDAWRERVTKYVDRQGNGDWNVLRDAVDARSPRALRPSPVVIGELDIAGPGLPPFVETHDAQGVLLGVREVQGRPWYFFLVGVIKRPPSPQSGIEDIRLLACTAGSRGTRWLVAQETPRAVAQYLRVRNHGAPGGGAIFPSPTDVYRLSVTGQVAAAKEETSGATWQLPLPTELASR